MTNQASKLVLALTTTFVFSSAGAHHPHNPVELISISPDYPSDPLVIVSSPKPDVTLRSEDKGVTWVDASSGLRNTLIDLAYSANWRDSRRAFSIDQQGTLYETTDAARTWKAISGMPAWHLEMLWVETSEVPVVATRHDLFRVVKVEDSGQASFENIRLPKSGERQRITALTAQGAHLAVGVGTRLHVSSDAGANWESAELGGIIQDVEFSTDYENDGRIWVATHGAGVWTTFDRARSFVVAGSGIEDPDVNDIAISAGWPRKTELYAATRDDGVYKSVDGGRNWKLTWLDYGRSIQDDNHFLYVALPQFDHSSADVFVATYEGLHISRDGGFKWYSPNIKPTQMGRKLAISPSFERDQTLFHIGYGQAPLATTDGGNTWKRRSTGVGSGSIYSIELSPDFESDQTVMIGVHKGVRRSENGGRSWDVHELPTPPDNPKAWYPVFRDVTFSPAFERDGTVFTISVASWAKSTDRGLTWETHPAITDWGKFIVPTPTFEEDQTVLLGGTTLHLSTDGGENWKQVNAQIRGTAFNAVHAPDYKTSKEVYLYDRAGFQFSEDGGATWQSSDKGLDGFVPSSMAISPSIETDNTMFLGTEGGGLFKSTTRGRTWDRVPQTEPLLGTIKALEISPNFSSDRILFASNFDGVWISHNAGISWKLSTDVSVYDAWRPPWLKSGIWELHRHPDTEGFGVMSSNQLGDEISLPFVGTGIRILGRMGPKQGNATIFLDGEEVAQINMQRDRLIDQVLLYENLDLESTAHEILIRVGDRGAVSIDAADVYKRGNKNVLDEQNSGYVAEKLNDEQ